MLNLQSEKQDNCKKQRPAWLNNERFYPGDSKPFPGPKKKSKREIKFPAKKWEKREERQAEGKMNNKWSRCLLNIQYCSNLRQ